MLKQAAFDFIESLDDFGDAASLLGNFQRLIGKFGMDNFLVADITNREVQRYDRLWGTTWPFEWLLRYDQMNYIGCDPVIERMAAQTEPFRWTAVGQAEGKGSMRVINEAAEFGLIDGLAVPIYGGGGLAFSLSVSTRH